MPDLESSEINTPLGWWKGNGQPPTDDVAFLKQAVQRLDQPFWLLRQGDGYAIGEGGVVTLATALENGGAANVYPVCAYVPACRPEWMGDAGFCATHGLRFPYLAGAMANGIGSVEIVEAMGRAGMMAFFGAAGLPLARTEAAIDRIQRDLGELPFGFNLIHSPHEPSLEAATVDLYLRRGVRLVDASAYIDLTLPLIRYRVRGIRFDDAGKVVTPNRVIGKVSRIEVARRFFAPPPAKFLQALVQSGEITNKQAQMAGTVPVADAITAEADSGGHTDNQPFVTLLPTMLALRDELQTQHGYDRRLHVGAAGGISTPASVAAAFAMGAAYVMTGSVNQSCMEAGTSQLVRAMLCQTRQADVAMAPAADMFEMGVKVQVLKRGTMFAMRAAKLYEIYRSCGSLEEIPDAQRATLEKDLFRAPLEAIWEQTTNYFRERDPAQIERANHDPHHKMALVFRWYLGQSSNWANLGEPGRRIDYQIWCGPAMGAFNEWVQGSFLERSEERSVVTVALNLLRGGAILTRIQNLRAQGIRLPEEVSRVEPLSLSELREQLSFSAATTREPVESLRG